MIRTLKARSVISREQLEREHRWPRLDEAGYPMIDCFVGNEVVLEVPFVSRLVLLVTGRAIVRTTLQTDARVKHLRSASSTFVIWPEWCERLKKKLFQETDQ